MNKKLRDSIELASKKYKDAQLATNEIMKNLTFCGFGDKEPNISVRRNAEIFIVWRGSEMSIHEAVERMEEYGYINIRDFD